MACLPIPMVRTSEYSLRVENDGHQRTADLLLFRAVELLLPVGDGAIGTAGCQCRKFERLARVAVFNRECELARKYLGLLKKAWFHRSWAEKYESYLEHAESLKNDSDYKPIYALQQYENTLWEDNSVVESNILNHYANLESGTSGMLELSMASILITKSVAAF